MEHGFWRKPIMRHRGYSLLCAVMVLFVGCNDSRPVVDPPVRPVPLAMVVAGGPNYTRELLGQVDQTRVSPLAFEVDGRVTTIGYREGAEVAQGTVIARLETKPYRLQLQQAQAQVTQLTDDVRRKKVLLSENIISQAQYDRLVAQLKVARAKRDEAQRQLDETVLRAPFTGRLAQRRIEPGQVIQAGMPAFLLENNQRVDVSVGLPADIAQRLPLSASLTAQGHLVSSPGVTLLLHYREHQTQALMGESVYQLVLSGDKPADVELYPGMAVRVQLILPYQHTDAQYWVPVGALVNDAQGRYWLWRYQDEQGVVQKVPIQVHTLMKERALVSGSLHPGERVVSAGGHHLHDGQRVRRWVRD